MRQSTNAETTMLFIRKKRVVLTGHPPNSQDLAPLDFFYNNRIKKQLRGRKFRTEKSLVFAINFVIRGITKSEHHGCFNIWFERMVTYIEADGDYFEKK